MDFCQNGQCVYQQVSNSVYLKVLNPEKSWRKLKLGYSATNIWSPKVNTVSGGNNMLCITLSVPQGVPEWNKIQIRPQGSSPHAVILSNYISAGIGTAASQICIPVSAFGSFDFTQIAYFEFPFSNGANPFEIHVHRIEFTGGSTPFVWFGSPKTDNLHDGQGGSSSALIASLISSAGCGATKNDVESTVDLQENQKMTFRTYPNPFEEKIFMEVTVEESSILILDVFNINGQRLATIFEGEIAAYGSQTFEFASAAGSDVLIIRLQTPKQVLYSKAVMVK